MAYGRHLDDAAREETPDEVMSTKEKKMAIANAAERLVVERHSTPEPADVKTPAMESTAAKPAMETTTVEPAMETATVEPATVEPTAAMEAAAAMETATTMETAACNYFS
jgi:hypothetical protein